MADSIDTYIADFPDDVQPILQKIRTIMREALPEAVESISYGIPTFKLNGKYPIYFAGFKKHVSIYPILAECPGFEDEIAPYRSGRGTAKFPLDRPVPFPLITKLVQFMVQENAQRAAEKSNRKETKT